MRACRPVPGLGGADVIALIAVIKWLSPSLSVRWTTASAADPVDRDGDGVIDRDEDEDGDGVPDYLEPDDDGDGHPAVRLRGQRPRQQRPRDTP